MASRMHRPSLNRGGKMKLTIALILLASVSSYASDVFVHGYNRSNGTYVEPYHRSAPDASTFNNYSTRGNTNPYTGQSGTVNSNSLPSNFNNGSSTYGSGSGRSKSYDSFE